MQLDINVVEVLGWVFIGLMSVITWLLKQAVDHLKRQIEILHDADEELRKDIHNLDKNSITRTDFESFRQEVKSDNEKIYNRLNDVLKVGG